MHSPTILRLFVVFAFFLTGRSAFADPSAKICLTMIVKNESRIIERCLDSVKEVVDYVSISDTGSTDNTVALIESYLKTHGIPGQVHRQEWKNFGHNRTLSVQAAQHMLREMGAPLDKSYLLLLDADMVLQVTPEFSAAALRDDAYMVLQKVGSFAWYNTRLIRASLPWVSKGVTHEYWSCPISDQNTTLRSLVIDDQEDGGCKSDKFERDLRLLTDGLKDEPDNIRYLFYLAQTNKCLKKYDDAIRWYKARIEKGGWKEEVWYSKFMIGEIYEEMGFWDQALHWYLDAYQYYPVRAEPLKKVSGYYRFKGNHDLAHLFARQGASIPYPKDDRLFISGSVYDYQFDEDISISAYYTTFRDEGFVAVNRLALKKNLPQHVKDQAYRNMLFYVQPLKHVAFLPIPIERPPLQEGSDERYNASSSSIQRTDDGYTLICRTVNYEQKGGQEYKSRTPDDETIQTRNYLVKLDRDFHLISQQEIIEALPRERLPSKVQGLEDCRLVQGSDSFLGAAFDVPPGTIVQALCKIESHWNNKNLPIKSLVPLKGPTPDRCEKNWLPFKKDGALFAVYCYDPLIVLKLDEKTGACEEIARIEHERDFSRFRGSAGPIAFNDGYLLLIHEVTFTDQRMYTHRFVYLDKEFNVQKLSKPFTFMHTGIEYCCGMTLDHEGKNCVIPCSVEDREAYLCIVSKETIQSLLE